MMRWLFEADQNLMLWIQTFGVNEWTDKLMLSLRHAYTWVPLYLFLLIFSMRTMRPAIWIFIALSFVSFGLADFSSASIFKPLVERPRPCYAPEMEGLVRELVGCGGRYGFPSSHAANHFALATFWYWSIRLKTGQKWWWLFIWATAIGYAQVYVGKHYPLDIFGGAILGIGIGVLTAKIFEKWIHGKQALSKDLSL